MAVSEITGIGVGLESGGFEVSASSSQADSWSLDCNIAISGTITTEELSVDIDSYKANIMELDVNVVVNGVSSAFVESQIVPYEDIIKITHSSIEAVSETKYASSALAAKRIYDLAAGIEEAVSDINKNLETINEKIEDLEGGAGNGGDSYWTLGNDGILRTSYPVLSTGYVAGATATASQLII